MCPGSTRWCACTAACFRPSERRPFSLVLERRRRPTAVATLPEGAGHSLGSLPLKQGAPLAPTRTGMRVSLPIGAVGCLCHGTSTRRRGRPVGRLDSGFPRSAVVDVSSRQRSSIFLVFLCVGIVSFSARFRPPLLLFVVKSVACIIPRVFCLLSSARRRETSRLTRISEQRLRTWTVVLESSRPLSRPPRARGFRPSVQSGQEYNKNGPFTLCTKSLRCGGSR